MKTRTERDFPEGWLNPEAVNLLGFFADFEPPEAQIARLDFFYP